MSAGVKSLTRRTACAFQLVFDVVGSSVRRSLCDVHDWQASRGFPASRPLDSGWGAELEGMAAASTAATWAYSACEAGPFHSLHKSLHGYATPVLSLCGRRVSSGPCGRRSTAAGGFPVPLPTPAHWPGPSGPPDSIGTHGNPPSCPQLWTHRTPAGDSQRGMLNP